MDLRYFINQCAEANELKRVKAEVYDTTNKEQEPWHNSALRREFYFNPQ